LFKMLHPIWNACGTIAFFLVLLAYWAVGSEDERQESSSGYKRTAPFTDLTIDDPPPRYTRALSEATTLPEIKEAIKTPLNFPSISPIDIRCGGRRPRTTKLTKVSEKANNLPTKSKEHLRPSSPPKGGTGFFNSFSPEIYRAGLRELSDAGLRKKEKSKIHSDVGALAGLLGATFTTILSGGMAAPLAAIPARKLYLAEKKLYLIREELERRGLDLRPELKRDVFKGMLKNPGAMVGIPNMSG